MNFGIIGGVGPLATCHLYQELIINYKALYKGKAPEILIYSLPVTNLLEANMISGKISDTYVHEIHFQLFKAFQVIERFKPSTIVLACNTLTPYAKTISKTRFMNPVDATINTIISSNFKSVTILSTNATRKLRIFDEILNNRGVTCIYPSDLQQNIIVKYILANLNGIVACDIENELEVILKDLAERSDVIILGCTDLYPIYKIAIKLNISVIDSLSALVMACINNEKTP